MTRLGQELPIISMAHALGIHEGDPVDGILAYCRDKIRRVTKREEISSIGELEALVCDRYNLSIVEVWSDEDLGVLIDEHARKHRDFAFVELRNDLDSETFATLIRRKQRSGETEDHYVAVIDCRGQKGARRFFTRWHEIAHVLTMCS